MTIKCETCELDTDCRIGYSNRDIQPIQFSCPHCHTGVEITLDITNAPESRFEYKGCYPSENQPTRFFEGDNPFVDLHLDFPVKFGGYTPGLTPWFASLHQINEAVEGDQEKALRISEYVNARLWVLNDLCGKAGEIKKILNLYGGANKILFQKRAAAFLEEKVEESILPEDLNATLYKVLAKAFFPFFFVEEIKEISDYMPRLMSALNQEAFQSFIDEIFESGFIDRLHRDCLRLYPRIFEAELPLRPALFLDFVKDESASIAARVSTSDFFVYKDLYKDITEIIGRQLVVVAGINNICHRNDFNSFKPVDGGALSSLEKFSKKALSDKFKYLDDAWFQVSHDEMDLELRNSVAHNNVEYDAVKQTVFYHPKGGGLNVEDPQEMTFLKFMRLMLLSFREMNRLHHVMKSLFYYKYLIVDKE